MPVEQQVKTLVDEGRVADAVVLLARELDATRAAAEPRPASELTPSERAALLQRARAILDEMGDGSE